MRSSTISFVVGAAPRLRDAEQQGLITSEEIGAERRGLVACEGLADFVIGTEVTHSLEASLQQRGGEVGARCISAEYGVLGGELDKSKGPSEFVAKPSIVPSSSRHVSRIAWHEMPSEPRLACVVPAARQIGDEELGFGGFAAEFLLMGAAVDFCLAQSRG